MAFVLSSIISGHNNDVRSVACIQDRIVSGSRDGTAKLWALEESLCGDESMRRWTVQTTFSGHRGFVSSITTREPDEEYPEGLIYTGCQDGVIRLFTPSQSTPLQALEGHSANVVSLFVSKTRSLISGSWDHTAKVWLNGKEMFTLQGHTMGVWAVIILPESGVMVTGSADKSIKLWKAGRCRKTLQHHSQSVRDLAVVSSSEFISCANDHRITVFKLKNDEMDCDVTFQYDDVDYIYSLATKVPSTGWVVSGENIGIRVFQDQTVTDCLAVPTSSVWCVCILPNGDIVAGCSDHKIYVFTADSSRRAPSDLQAVYSAEVDRFTRALIHGGETNNEAQSLPPVIGGVKVEDIPGPDALQRPGKRDGQTKMIKSGGNVSVHEWSQARGEWSKVGDIVTDQDKTGVAPNNKTMFEGVEYDFVFNIDIDEGVVLKLPFNRGQDPYHVSQEFIHKHDLPQSYLDEIANFIFKNSGSSSVQVGQAVDPFTGGNAYVSGSGGVPTARDFASGGLVADPFTGGGAYVSGSGGVPTASDIRNTGRGVDPFTGGGAYVTADSSARPAQENNFFPIDSPITFNALPKMDALIGKLCEFNEKVPLGSKLSEDEINRIAELGSTVKSSCEDLQLLLKALRWPAEYIFPCLDLARLAFLNPSTSNDIISEDVDCVNLLELIIVQLKNKSLHVNQMLALKVLSNMFSSTSGSSLMSKVRPILFEEFSLALPSDNKNIQLGVSTLHLNYSVLAVKANDPDAIQQCLVVGAMLLELITFAESKFRTLVALGTLLTSQNVRQLATELDIAPKVKTWKEIAEMPKIEQCASFLLDL